MLILKSPNQLTQIHQSEILNFLHQRFHDICFPEPYDPEEHGFFILIQPGDTSELIESETGYSLTTSLFTGSVYGDSDFTPDFEYLEDHGSFFEAVQIFTDGGFAVVFIIPKGEDINHRILALCHEFATTMNQNNPHPEPLNPDVDAFVKRLDINQREYFEERAGIAEFEAGMSRAEAEHFALELTKVRFNLAGI